MPVIPQFIVRSFVLLSVIQLNHFDFRSIALKLHKNNFLTINCINLLD